jgi:hypothetical protein
MKRIAWASCVIAVLQALTGCCSCCDMNRGAQCYSNCLPANNGCCGNNNDFALPPSPYGYQQGGMRMRGQRRNLPPMYSTDPYVDMGTQAGDGSMYESFDGNAVQGNMLPQGTSSDSGWQPKPAGPMPTAPSVPATPDAGPSALYSVPQPIPAISSAPGQVPGPPNMSNVPRTTNSSLSGPDMGPTPPPAPDPVSQMGYRTQAPIQRAF